MAITKVTTPVTGFESAVDIGLKIPVGTNSNLPTGVEGMIRNDTDEDSGGTNSTTAITYFNGTDWKYFNSTPSQDNPPSENFNTVLYTGDGSTSGQSITTVGFQPDLVWIKTRNQNTRHILTDSVRGVNSQLFSNETFDERNYLEFTSFDDYGFTVKRDLGTDYLNQSGINYVAWCYKAGGLKNKSADFNGSSSYVDTTFTWPGSATLSFSAWFKTDTINVSHYIVGDFNAAGAGTSRRFLIKIAVNNDLQVAVNNGVGSGTSYTFGNMSSYLNKWTHIAVTVSGTEVKAYINGTQFGSTFAQGTALAAGGSPFCIGSYTAAANKQNFYGLISQVRFFTDVLTTGEVTQLYNETAANNSVLDYPTGTNCIAAYPLGINANNLSNNNNGTASNVTFGLPGYLTRNNEGTIESTVSVNNNLGFSIAKYTGPALIANTVGHGLGQTPEMIILKSTSVNRNWNVFHKDVGTSKNMYLNEASIANTSEYWTASTDTFSIQDYSASANWIAYCFVSKPGFSKVGSYTGNGGNNPVDVGFEPAFVMIKKSTISNASWAMFDNKRTTANPSTSALYANEAAMEDDQQLYFQFTSTGFKNLQSSNTLNTSGSIYIYLAFAN